MTTRNSNNHVWISPEPDIELRKLLSGELSVHPITAQILINRGLRNKAEAHAFLHADLSTVHDYFLLNDIDIASDRIKEAIKQDEKIVVYGDFDVDGITSTALLCLHLESLGAQVDYYIPSRIEEGYGLNNTAIGEFAENNTSLLLTCDCGITANEEVEYAKSLGIDVIITDHHEPAGLLPDALAVINPKRNDSAYPFKELAGVGVAFKLISALAETAKIANQYLDLVSIGTIADIVPLIDENRAIVIEGLKLINSKPRTGIKALAKIAGLDPKNIKSENLAFTLAPRLNAAGRLEKAENALKLLMTDDEEEAVRLAEFLHAKNRERQEIEQKMFEEAVHIYESDEKAGVSDAIILFNKDWHEGVKGIVASRIVERYKKPALIFTERDGLLVGSARSIKGLHIQEALSDHSDILEDFGGHEYAAGLSCLPDNFEKFRSRFFEYVSNSLSEEHKKPVLNVDCWVEPRQISHSLSEELAILEPYGAGNPRPIFASSHILPQSIRRLSGGKHLKFNLGMFLEADALFFNPSAHQIEQVISSAGSEGSKLIDIAYTLTTSEWKGRRNLDAKIVTIRQSAPLDEDEFIESLFVRAEELIRREDYKNIGDAGSFYTKVAGVSFDGRQDNIKLSETDTALLLVREPDNEFDPNAIRVITSEGVDIGFINARLAKQLAPCIDKGIKYIARITDVTGGDDCNLGVNIEVKKQASGPVFESDIDLSKNKEALKSLDDRSLWDHLKERFIGEDSREKQDETWQKLLSGNNCLAIMGTGRGKSAIFHVYAAWRAIKENKKTVIVYPLRALASDQMHFLSQRMTELGLQVFHLTGDLSLLQRDNYFEMLAKDLGDIILTTPEFLHFHLDRFIGLKSKIGFFVADEAHHICTSTEAHRPLYKKIGWIIDRLGDPQVLAVTATADNNTASSIVSELKIDETIIDTTVRDNLRVIDCRDCEDKRAYIENVLSAGEKTIIYVNSREQSVELAQNLRLTFPRMRNDIAYYNAGLDGETRSVIEDRFRSGALKVIMATSAFGEGVNIPDIRNVIHYHLTFNEVEFNQQSGRAGRDNKESAIHLIFGQDDARLNELILECTAPSRESLTELYKAIQRLSRGNDERADSHAQTKAGNDEICKMIEDINGFFLLNEQGVDSGLKIFEELGLVELKGSGPHRLITILPKPEIKKDLSESVRYQEGIDEKQMFKKFKDWIFTADAAELLAAINRPIYPVFHEVGS